MTAYIKKLWKKNEYFQTAVMIGLIVLVIAGLYFGSQAVLGTNIPPALAVVSGSMCIPYDGACENHLFTHPFARTLHVGDIIVIQGVDPKELNTDYPNSDIIVFREPGDPNTLIVHRILSAVQEPDGSLQFYTKGDGNPPVDWPNDTDAHDYWGLVSEDAVIGKVVMRIPWIGMLSIWLGDYNIAPFIVILIVILIIMEFVIPLIRRKSTNKKEETQTQTEPAI